MSANSGILYSWLSGVCIAFTLMASPDVAFSNGDLVMLSDGELSVVSGQSGIALELGVRANTDASGNPIGGSGGTACGAGTSYTDGVAEVCRLAINYNNRTDEWVVLKDYYGVLTIGNLFIDAGCTSGTLSSGVCSGGASTTNYDDMARFNSQAGGCLLTGSGSGCVSGDANNLPSLVFSIPGSAATFEDDILFGLTVGGMAVEYGVAGFNSDANGSFLGVRLADRLQPQARIDLDGRLKVFGF